MNLPVVSVLMSTYNGNRYIREQIDSILHQTGVEVLLLIRDDGSRDDTVEICREYAEKYENVTFYQGQNIGVGKSFFDLLRNAPDAEYYSFADQDDVWCKDKLSRAVEIIRSTERKKIPSPYREGYPLPAESIEDLEEGGAEHLPVLYGSNQMLVDEQLRESGIRFHELPKCDFYSSISKNIIYGCTMVMNRSLRDNCSSVEASFDEILKHKNHDGLVLYISYITGVFVFDRESRIMYRQHESQVVGVKEVTPLENMVEKVRRVINKKNKGTRSRFAKELLNGLSERMIPEVKTHLQILSNADTRSGVMDLLHDAVLVNSFGEAKWKIFCRGMIKWI